MRDECRSTIERREIPQSFKRGSEPPEEGRPLLAIRWPEEFPSSVCPERYIATNGKYTVKNLRDLGRIIATIRQLLLGLI